ncbi:iron-sulfur cluster biosynthesis family protein [Thalassobacillus sp. CUG 92003]|uniref:iron-sulfur cluster biosynthesis family protein n=1 Tax=Thalassobacillus sp. CUG 92003 TaxID=2736641 RepID=UPI0015E7D893|nr:iron-sulfur cluster biosynthesis family protein [Thalassobacillus sp. CUG 92003]
MKLNITGRAEATLRQLAPPEDALLRLDYDSEGCGCGVNGVPVVRWTRRTDEWDEPVDNPLFDVIVHRQEAVFFQPEMKLDFINNAFRLSSPQGILNPIISPQTVVKEVHHDNKAQS